MEPILRAAFIMAGAIVLLAAATIFSGSVAAANLDARVVAINVSIGVAVCGLGLLGYGLLGRSKP